MGVNLINLGNNGVIYRKNISLIAKEMVNRSIKPWLYSDFMYKLFGYQKKLDGILKPVHDFTKSIIKERKANFLNKKEASLKKEENENIYMSKKKRYAMMDTLLQAQSEGLIDDEGIIEETDTFTFEGHDTTSAGMTFTLLLLSHHPEVQEKLFEEIQEFIGDEDFSMDIFNKMPYMDRVLKECLRLYPPVPFIARTLTEDLNHEGVFFPKGTNVEIFIYDIHRDPEVFPDPEKFDPDRFLPEECDKRNNFAFLAFSAGMVS
jgi:cytochrome P450 family 4